LQEIENVENLATTFTLDGLNPSKIIESIQRLPGVDKKKVNLKSHEEKMHLRYKQELSEIEPEQAKDDETVENMLQ
jgi:HSP20 family molecular chaperone IbpA